VTFTAAQLKVLDEIERHRVTVVRAGPGAGKTRVFVEAFKREIERSEQEHRRGVAALSFTNVAHEEISRRMGRTVSAPHFVGTLDTFLFRFVVRPFGSLVGLTPTGARLLPSPLDEVHPGPEVQFAPDPKNQTSIFLARCVAGPEEAPVIHVEKAAVDDRFAKKLLSAKQAHWKANGRVTHADVHYLAARILHGPHGASIGDVLAKRFGVLLVDEFQDTGHFLGRALLPMLASPSVRGVVVGDPDQAIFRFGGAQQTLFHDVDAIAARQGPLLDESHRCSRAVAAVATALSRSGKTVRPLADAPDGRAIMFVYEEPPEIATVTAKLEIPAEEHFATLARSNATVRKLSSGVATAEAPRGSRFGKRMSKAVERFTDGDPNTAARVTQSVLGELVFDDANIDPEALRAQSIPWLSWRKACHAVLFEAMQVKDGEAWNAWLTRVRDCVRKEAETLGRPIAKLGQKVRTFGNGGETVRYTVESASVDRSAHAMTIHQAKGREFATVIFYVPKPHSKYAPCPSTQWWSTDPSSEERETAFVACSRAMRQLALVVHKKTFDALSSSQAGFVGLFEVVRM
jgi:DNA helicase-2/ATP-dependent DNA helicase PcrA